jgi:acetate kinase
VTKDERGRTVCAATDFIGIELDPHRSPTHTPIISRDGGLVVIRVMKTDEDLMIARHTHRLISQGETNHVPI